MCKDRDNAIIISVQGEEKKNGYTGNCNKCPFGEVLIAPQFDIHGGLLETIENINKVIDYDQK